MPEGDTVFLAATRMHTALAGQRLVAPRLPRAPLGHSQLALIRLEAD
jgi:hypothetical protein